MIYASIEDGILILSNHDNTERTFSLDANGKVALAETLKEWDGIESVMCSSSVDFAEEYGVPEDVDVRDFIGKAQLLAAGPSKLYFTVEQLEEVIQRLRDGDVEAVVERIERNVEMVKRQYEEALAE